MSLKAPPPTATAIIPSKDSIQYRSRSYSKRTRQTTMHQMQLNNKFSPPCQKILYSRIMPVWSVCGCCLLQTQMRNGALSGSWPRLQMLVGKSRSGCRGVGRWVECQRLSWRTWVCFWDGLIGRDPPKSCFDISAFILRYTSICRDPPTWCNLTNSVHQAQHSPYQKSPQAQLQVPLQVSSENSSH